MRPSTKAGVQNHSSENINVASSEGDAMMMSFEFFDEKGHLNPRKILFTEQTCPNKTQRILSNLFGKIMIWHACRWAENFLKNTKIKQTVAHDHVTSQVDSLLQDIRANGFVRMTELFSVIASASTEVKPSKTSEQEIIPTHRRFTSHSQPFLINHTEINQQFHPQDRSIPQKELSPAQTISTDSKSQQTYLAEACAIIEKQWDQFSQLHEVTYVPEQFILPAKSGFLDYCKGKKISITGDQIAFNEEFIHLSETEWLKYKNLFTPAQFSAWTQKRDEWIIFCENQGKYQPVETKKPRAIDLRLGLKIETPTFREEKEPTIYQAFAQYSLEFNALGHGKIPLPKQVEDMVDSGFLVYCDKGPSALRGLDIHDLEKFLVEYEGKWDSYSTILTPNQYSQLLQHRDTINQDIATFRKNNPSSLQESTPESNQESDAWSIEKDQLIPDPVNPIGLFPDGVNISFDHLNRIEWDAADLPDRISLDDAKKLDNYFSSAELNAANSRICKKIHDLAKEMLDRYISRVQIVENEGTGNADNTFDILNSIYAKYLDRYTAANDGKKTSSGTKKSKKSKKSPQHRKSIQTKATNKIRAHQTSRNKTAPKKIEENLRLDEKKFNQQMRNQINEANDLINRLNKEQ